MFTIEHRKHFLKGCIYALIGAFLWGFSGICAEVLVDGYTMSPAFITLVRAVIAASIMVGIAVVRRRKRLVAMLTNPKTMAMVFLSGFGIFMSQYAYAQSVAYTNAGTATVLQSPACVLVMFVVCIELKRAPQKYQVLGVLLALAGTWLIATGGDFSTLALPPEGLVWGAINSCAIALYILIPRTLFERYGSSCPIALSIAADAVIAAVFWLITDIVNPAELSHPIFTPWSLCVLVLGAGVLGTMVAFSFYLHGCSIVGSVTGSLIGAIEPLSAMFLATTLLGHVMGWADWLGMALMMVMICLIALPAEGSKQVDRVVDIPKRSKKLAKKS